MSKHINLRLSTFKICGTINFFFRLQQLFRLFFVVWPTLKWIFLIEFWLPVNEPDIEITAWLASAYDFYARVVKDC